MHVGYDEHFRHLNVWMDKFAASPNGRYITTQELYPFEELFKNEFYNDWFKPQEDVHVGGAVMLFGESDRFPAFGSHIRAKDRGRLEDDFECLARLLTPHVQQAFEINRALDGKDASDFVAGLAARSSTGILLLRRE